MNSARDHLTVGFPHSEIVGSKPARGSPTLIAACYVLHRLSVPRHPRNALMTLDRFLRRGKPNAASTYSANVCITDTCPILCRTDHVPDQEKPIHDDKEPCVQARNAFDNVDGKESSTSQRITASSDDRLRGGASRDRTDDLKLAKLALSQLSYGPVFTVRVWWAREDLNLRPHAYQACALTN